MKRRKQAIFGAAAVGVGVLAMAAWAGVAAAVSVPPYQPSQQDCQANSDAWNAPNGTVDPGCHNAAVNVESGDGGTRYVEWGNNEVPNDPNSIGTPTLLSIGLPGYTGSPHSGCLAANTGGTNGGTGTGCGENAAGNGFEANYDYYAVFCPIMAAAGNPCEDTNPGQNTFSVDHGGAVNDSPIVQNGLLVYFGMNDNTDNGEHDGVSGLDNAPCSDTTGTYNCDSDQVVNGPSDGGGMLLSLTPQAALQTFSVTHPSGSLNYSEGECADGICSAVSTQQQSVYHGGGSGSADVFTNSSPASTQEPAWCSSGDAQSESCGGSGLDPYYAATPANENVDPGIQTYQDPDPQRSPAAPFGTPGTYVGTCGAYVNAGSDSVGPGPVSFLTGGNVADPNPGWVVQTDPSC